MLKRGGEEAALRRSSVCSAVASLRDAAVGATCTFLLFYRRCAFEVTRSISSTRRQEYLDDLV